MKTGNRYHLQIVKYLSVIYIALGLFLLLQHYIGYYRYIGYYGLVYFFYELIEYIPVVLFIIHLFCFHNNSKSTVLLTLSYITAVLVSGYFLLEDGARFLSDILWLIKRFDTDSLIELIKEGINIGLNTLSFAVNLFFIVNSVSRFKYRNIGAILIIVQTCAKIVPVAMSVAYYVSNCHSYAYYYIGKTNTVYGVISRFLPLAMISAYFIFWKYCAEDTSGSTLEKTLYNLKQSYESGAMTQIEYERQKAEIIGKL